VVFEELLALKAKNRDTKLARRLAENYNRRRLVKCVFEKIMQREDRTVEEIFNQRRFRSELTTTLAESADTENTDIYIDVPTTPSVPYTYEKEALDSITLFSNDGGERRTTKLSIAELTLVGSITGFTDILRVYTTPEHRLKVARAVQKLFGKEDPIANVPG